MRWIKKGLIYTPRGDREWALSHAQLPVADEIDESSIRIYYSTRDKRNRSVTTFIDVQADNPANVLYVHDRPVLGLGELDCFDDDGAMATWIISHKGLKYLYYIGWNAGVSVSYRNAIGLAVSDDGGRTFDRLFQGPIVDRSKSEPHFCGSCCVLIDNGVWRMWYLSAIRWEVSEGRPEPVYHLKYAESGNGIDWDRRGVVCIDLASPEEGGISRPCVVQENGIYRMWYSYRGIFNYRTDRSQSYRMGTAVSDDGIEWHRTDNEVGINVSDDGWDSEMIEYGHFFDHNSRQYLFYNGNGFGRSGIGYCVGEG